MKQPFIVVAIVALCAVLVAFANQPQKKNLEYKWFKYRTGEPGVPTPDADNAKDASNYVLVGSQRYCNGTAGYCGIYAQPSDETASALPVLNTAEQDEIDKFFIDPGTYYGSMIDRRFD